MATTQAEAAKKIAKAEGEAKSLVTRAQGEADANRIRQNSLTPQLLELRRIENNRALIDKWKWAIAHGRVRPGTQKTRGYFPAAADEACPPGA